jgi:hypothetical protein
VKGLYEKREENVNETPIRGYQLGEWVLVWRIILKWVMN